MTPKINPFFLKEIDPLNNRYDKIYGIPEYIDIKNIENNENGFLDFKNSGEILKKTCRECINCINENYALVKALPRDKFAPFRRYLYCFRFGEEIIFTHFYDVFYRYGISKLQRIYKQPKIDCYSFCNDSSGEYIDKLRIYLANDYTIVCNTHKHCLLKCFNIVKLIHQLFGNKYDLNMFFNEDKDICINRNPSANPKAKKIKLDTSLKDKKVEKAIDPDLAIMYGKSTKIDTIYNDEISFKGDVFEHQLRYIDLDKDLKSEKNDFEKQSIANDIITLTNKIQTRKEEMTKYINDKVKEERNIRLQIKTMREEYEKLLSKGLEETFVDIVPPKQEEEGSDSSDPFNKIF